MRKVFSLILLGLFLSSCGPLLKDLQYKESKGGSRQFNATNPVFSSYINNFEAEAIEQYQDPSFRVGDIPINFGDTENQQFDGVCFVYENGKKEIIIKKQWWDQASEHSKEIIIFHELGHCRLGRVHNDEIITIGNQEIKSSIMNSVIPHAGDYQSFRDNYLFELFTESLSAFFEDS